MMSLSHYEELKTNIAKAMKLLKFYTEHCPQCKALSRTLEGLKDIEVQNVDCEEEPDLVNKYQVKTLPTLVLVDDKDEAIKKMTGVVSTDVLQGIINCELKGLQWEM